VREQGRESERERERGGGEDKGESGRAGSDRSRFIRSESLVRRVSFADTRRDYRAERHRDPSVTFVKGARDDVP